MGYEIHATASDLDGGVTITRWVWERSDEITSDDSGALGCWARSLPVDPLLTQMR